MSNEVLLFSLENPPILAYFPEKVKNVLWKIYHYQQNIVWRFDTKFCQEWQLKVKFL